MSDPGHERPLPEPGAGVLDRRHRALYRRIGALVGAVLVVAGVVVVVRNQAVADSLGRALAKPDWPALALLLMSTLAMQALTSWVFWLLMNRHGRVGFTEMNALVAASTLGNYIPMQAGSLGRIAYHKAVNRIDVRASIVAMLQATVLTFVCVCVLGAGALVAKAASAPWWCVLPVPLLWLPLAIEPGLRTYALVAFVRSIEILVWALHAWAAFRISGWPIEPETAIGVSLVGSAANLVPFMGNGLGVREWAVALAAPILGGYERDAGLAAELMGRAFDVVVAIPLGLAGVGALVRRARAVEQRAAHARAAPHAQ
ncbi:MAG: hypothetical protein U0625_11805 [Phycisphaerales bacterium]